MSLWLLIVVAMTHLGTELAAKQFGIDRAWLFYIARGMEGAFLYALLMKHSPIVAAIALWGFVESAMTSVCGSLFIFTQTRPKPFEGLCDAQLGMPIFHYLGLVAASILALSIAIRRRHV